MNVLVWNQDLSSACRSVAGFQLGSKMMTRFAPVMFKPTPPHLQEKRGWMSVCVCVCVGRGGGMSGCCVRVHGMDSPLTPLNELFTLSL